MRAVFFDLDDTLIDRGAALGRWLRDRCARRGLATPDAADLLRVRDRAAICRALVARAPAIADTADALELDLIERLATFVEPHAGVFELLARVGERHRIAIVSDGSARMQRAKLAAAELDELPAFLSGDLGFEKPDRRVFEYALRWAGCAPADALFVGDDPTRDVAGAAAAGMRTAWIAHGRAFPSSLPAPDFTLASVLELPRVLPC